ncbi:BirA family transcriptional regulator, biotin operon repressor / biotin-[acetyl-CoA-carboxylase] ligase [Allopseudospirillum japonicum]|uniref:Bifunctional ligase/repressor BirA n=1 Tax=Allopseudospirillum japonicum TaxID=64971 RepID=A0A1H6UMB3_9GAMM|nr:biotin--[acetyl-CoA-carboxylase] ligase [Allopseudospirillum japonicum]SEI89205.1 BirA family transcriptional regulator, biotin operon repressor / biotin-[acetyl-CoA-carboxylase] ligase [Allopseudospirillum japonicum]
MDLYTLIKILADGHYHSGEEIGQAIGVSRTAVWKQLKKLETLGLEVEATKGLGYRFNHPLDLLNQHTLFAYIPEDKKNYIGDLDIQSVTDSTNQSILDEFKQIKFRSKTAYIKLAEMQTGGRGRRGRTWLSPYARSLSLSMGWQFEQGVQALEGLSLAVGVCVARVLAAYGIQVDLKWPNDVLAQGAKLAGILVELAGDLSGPCQVVLGIGLNYSLTEQEKQSLTQPVIGITDLVRQPNLLKTRNQLAADLIVSLLDLFNSFEKTGFQPYQNDWNQHHAYTNQEVYLILGHKKEKVLALGVDERGALKIQRDGQCEHLQGGEISIRPV